MDDRDDLIRRVAVLEQLLPEAHARIAELEQQLQELQQRGKRYRPKAKHPAKPKPTIDRRTQEHRQHLGVFRPAPVPDEHTLHEDVQVACCPHCGGAALTPTGHFGDHLVEDLPVARVEVRRFRRHEYRCGGCQRTCQGRGDLELPGAHVGPHARLAVGYARAHLGLSLGKTCALFQEFFGLALSRAGALGHLRWGSALTAPVVAELFAILRTEDVVHADETGWRINGTNVWTWCFANRRLALFLIHRHRSADVLREALGDSLPGVLVTDFYAAYNRLTGRKQRCLVHLLRELHTLADELPGYHVREHIRPLTTVILDSLALAKSRPTLAARSWKQQRQALDNRFWDCLARRARHDEVRRIHRRLLKHYEELFTFLDDPQVPPDNNLAERDIRSVAAARQDGGVNRTAWGATAFANLKSVVRTCHKNGRNFLDYGLSPVRATLTDHPRPLPLNSS